MTRILGIESSCDETAAAVVADGREILSSVVASQTEIHRKYGGVVPELASREHLRQIVPVVREAIEQAHTTLAGVDAVAVNHLEGHVHAVFLEAHAAGRKPELPAVCLIVSGGHTVIYHVTSEIADG